MILIFFILLICSKVFSAVNGVFSNKKKMTNVIKKKNKPQYHSTSGKRVHGWAHLVIRYQYTPPEAPVWIPGEILKIPFCGHSRKKQMSRRCSYNHDVFLFPRRFLRMLVTLICCLTPCSLTWLSSSCQFSMAGGILCRVSAFRL